MYHLLSWWVIYKRGKSSKTFFFETLIQHVASKTKHQVNIVIMQNIQLGVHHSISSMPQEKTTVKKKQARHKIQLRLHWLSLPRVWHHLLPLECIHAYALPPTVKLCAHQKRYRKLQKQQLTSWTNKIVRMNNPYWRRPGDEASYRDEEKLEMSIKLSIAEKQKRSTRWR